jgi:ribose transport system permease protein
MRELVKKVTDIREFMILAIIAVFFIVMTFASPYFLNADNLLAVMLGLSVETIIAVSMTVLLISGGFDLSVGSIAAFAGIISAICMRAGSPVAVAILLGIVVGGAIGLFNGFIIAKVGINPFITTLATMMAVRGLVLVVGKTNISGFPYSFIILGQGKFFGVQSLIIIAVITVIIGDILLRKSRFFRQNYYIGGNEKAAMLSGIKVNSIKMFNYCLSGLMAAFAGILMTSRLDTASLTAGDQMEFRIITAVIIGGASLNGGEGTALGAFLGALLMALISNALTLLGVDVRWNKFVIGGTLLLAVIIDNYSQKKKLK